MPAPALSLALAALLAAGAPPPALDPDDLSPIALPGRPADLALRPARSGGPAGQVWAVTTPAGLVLRGEVAGERPAFAAREEDLAAGARLELTLAAPRDPALPAGALRTLFTRRWQLSGRFAAETLASEAYATLADERPIRALEPRVLPELRTVPVDRGWRFEIHVPWSALPPQAALTVREVRLALALAGPGKQVLSTTSPRGRRAALSTVRLASPPTFRVTPCDEPLAGEDPRGRTVPAWFVPPIEGEFVDEVIVVTRGPAGAAVLVEPRSYLDAGPDTYVCLPRVAVRRNGKVHRLGFTATEATLKRIAGGALLLVSGRHTLLVSPDWSRLEVFDPARPRAGGAPRAVRALCLRGDRYEACAHHND